MSWVYPLYPVTAMTHFLALPYLMTELQMRGGISELLFTLFPQVETFVVCALSAYVLM